MTQKRGNARRMNKNRKGIPTEKGAFRRRGSYRSLAIDPICTIRLSLGGLCTLLAVRLNEMLNVGVRGIQQAGLRL